MIIPNGNPDQRQQGDVLLQYISKDELPKGLKKLSPTKIGNREVYVMAYGETTGHAHMLEDIENVNVYEKPGGGFYVQVLKPQPLKHLNTNQGFKQADHHTCPLEPGFVEIDQVVQETFDGLVQKVVD